MAEVATPKTRKHLTAIAIHDSSGSIYSIPVYGDLSYTPGGYTLVESRASDGSFSGVGPVIGTENPTSFSVECVQRGLSDSDGVVNILKDFLDNLEVDTAANTTGSEPAGAAAYHAKMYDVVCTFTDSVGTETLTFPDTTFIGSSYTTNLDDVNKITLSGTSRQAYPTVSFA